MNRNLECIIEKSIFFQEDSLASGCADQLKCRRVNEHGDQFIRQARVVRQRLREATEDLKNYPENTFGTGRARHEQVNLQTIEFHKTNSPGSRSCRFIRNNHGKVQ